MMQIRKNLDYFTSPHFLDFDGGAGVLRSRGGTRMVAVNEDWLRGFVGALEHEAGSATPAILQRCGEFFGDRLAQRFDSELSGFAGVPLRDRTMNEFCTLLDDLWVGCGMGKLEIDWSRAAQFLPLRLLHSPMQDIGPSGHVGDDLFAGILLGFFSRLADQKLQVFQTGDERLGDREGTTFILGPQSVIDRAKSFKEEGHRHSEIVERLS
ncbi:MAG TPA: hypothetical protein RMG48_11765 [Myxococcales bacterium LLY-WYZ-16_1]|jgi:hypothetical protein|nr:hypothetical protein [Myxococcales bacterium LLY-WYZ-16_1]